MKKRRVLHQACAFSVAVMLVGVNAVPVVAADNSSVATYATTDDTQEDRGDIYADVHVDKSKGYFTAFGPNSTAVSQSSNLTYGGSIYLEPVTALEGWTWTGWKITAPDGFEEKVTDTTQTTYSIVSYAKGAYKVEATFEQDIPDDRQVKVTFNNVDNATLASGYPTSEYGFWGDDSATYSVPEYKVADGYEITGWTVTGETTTTWSKDKTSFGKSAF